MRNAIVKGLCAGALWILLEAPAGWTQNSAIAPLINTGTVLFSGGSKHRMCVQDEK